MAEPISTSSGATVAALTGAGAVSLVPGIDPATALGAFAGAAVFALNASDLSTPKKLAFLLLSIVAGVLTAPLSAGLIATFLPAKLEVSEGVGALVASALAVKVLIAFIGAADQSDRLLSQLRNNKRGGSES